MAEAPKNSGIRKRRKKMFSNRTEELNSIRLLRKRGSGRKHFMER
jgi:hypothetical protein